MKPVVIPLSLSQVYLLPCKGGYLQVDTGYDRDYPLYRKNLARAGIKISAIQYILLTHHHDDHAGFLNEITRDTPLTILAHEKAGELLKTGQNDKTRGGGYINRFIHIVASIKMRLDPHWTLSFQPFTLREQDQIITADDSRLLRDMGIDGTILCTPGHCIDHLVLVLDSGEVFCGDAASSFLLWAGLKYCTLFMTDMEQSYQSWQKILNTGGKIIYPAHGRPFSAEKLRQHQGKIKNSDLIKFF